MTVAVSLGLLVFDLALSLAFGNSTGMLRIISALIGGVAFFCLAIDEASGGVSDFDGAGSDG